MKMVLDYRIWDEEKGSEKRGTLSTPDLHGFDELMVIFKASVLELAREIEHETL